MTLHSASTTPTEDGQTVGQKRRRLESEMLTYQSDRARLMHQKEALEIERRSMGKDIEMKTIALQSLARTSEKLNRDIVILDSELLRLRKRFNSL